MCGINGILNFNGDHVDKGSLVKMNSRMIHRGPDDDGFYIDKNLGFSMRRLSIIDIDGGHQPISNEDGRYTVVLNGEIYNYIELREELEKKGHSFKTKTDTEILVHIYEEMGEKCLEKLNGMFAFAIWDSMAREMFIALDRFGIKTLFFYTDNSRFCFSSELKSILTLNFNKKIDYSSILLYLFILYIPSPKSAIQGVYKLEPATYMKIDERGNIIKKNYWGIKYFNTVNDVNINEFKEEFLSLLNDAVSLQMRSDVPVGTFLSGGIDSSAVVAMLSKLRNGDPVRTFSVGYEGHNIDERKYARQIAEMYNTEHRELFLTIDNIRDKFRKIVWFMDEPIGDSAAIPAFLLSEIARDSGVKVILNGTGGDEIFGGYKRYVRGSFKNYVISQSKEMIKLSRAILQSPFSYKSAFRLRDSMIQYNSMVSGSILGLREYINSGHWFDVLYSGLNEVMSEKFNELNHLPEIERLMNFDIKTYLPGDLLFLFDKMTMGASIEGRVPLIDHRMVEFMSRIPANYKIKDDTLKYLVKKSLEGILPDDIIYREKMGFGAPVYFWLCNDIFNWFQIDEDTLSPVTKEIFQTQQILNTIKYKKYDRWNSQFIYNLIVFELWYRDVFLSIN